VRSAAAAQDRGCRRRAADPDAPRRRVSAGHMMARAIRTLSLRARLTIFYSLVLLAVCALFAAVVVWQQGRIGLRRVDRELDALPATLENVLQDELTEMPDAPAAAVEAHKTLAAPGHSIAILDRSGRVLAGPRNGPTVDEPTIARAEPAAWTAATPAGEWRAHLRPSRD